MCGCYSHSGLTHNYYAVTCKITILFYILGLHKRKSEQDKDEKANTFI